MGAIIIIPSGIFWRAIPLATVMASDIFPVPKLTPAAIPSGKLCIAMAATKRSILFNFPCFQDVLLYPPHHIMKVWYEPVD